jgi:PAS domain S-box-containing protein/diguanylate cyclase (GGDEF)-like protein
MKRQIRPNVLFGSIVIFFCAFITLKTISEYSNLARIETKIHYEESVILKHFLEAFRSTYQSIFINNHLAINETTLQFLPAVTISQISQEFAEVTESKVTVATVTDRPRNPYNMVDSVENVAFQYFLAHPQEAEYFKKISAAEESFFFYASPLFVDKTCLKCHGPRELVPPSISQKYTTAYDYKEGDLRGIISIKIQRDTINKDELIKLFFIKSTVITLLSSIVFLVVIFMLIRRVRRNDERYTRELEETVSSKTKELRGQINMLQEYSKVLDASAIVSRGDLKGDITYVNTRMCRTTGYAENELLGQPHSILRHPDVDEAVFQDIWNTIQSKSIWQGLVQNKKKDGSSSWAKSTICPIVDSDGEILEYIAARNDVTELVEKRQELQTLLTTDTLTGLPNRFQMLQDLTSLDCASVLLVDILDFSDINDFFGIEAGDLILMEFAHRVQEECAQSSMQLYRSHGDQLALLLQKSYQLDELKSIIEQLIERISNTPFLINNIEIVVHVTCGIAWNLKNPLLEADIALKQAKNNRQAYIINSEGTKTQQELQKNHNRIINIKNALRDKRVVTYYQPIIKAETGEIEKYECLVRIIEEDGKVISPFFFLDTAKKARIYTAITRAVIDNACNAFSDSSYDFSINLSTEDIQDSSVVEYLKTRLRESTLAQRAILEILETEGFANYDQVAIFIQEMKEMGCRIAIDDFGSGHSNYERLLNLHVDYLKIDGSIVKKITTDDISLTIVKAIVAVAQKLEILTVAEFVFDEKTAKMATALGVDYLQGYYFSEPLAKIKEDEQKAR